ncbi:MAG: hypothetical protein EBU46_04540 [Nitrosomonadaceae bacterium]|nr:hypothetical protein [Nitrosomonadaceae bacterium]
MLFLLGFHLFAPDNLPAGKCVIRCSLPFEVNFLMSNQFFLIAAWMQNKPVTGWINGVEPQLAPFQHLYYIIGKIIQKISGN